MSLNSRRFARTALMAVGLLAVPMTTGCGTLSILPFSQIEATQDTSLANFTVLFSIENAVSDPTQVASVNWVFGDDLAFETGEATISHRYDSAGQYDVSAFVFGPNGLLGEIRTTITVVQAEEATQPSPANGATLISIEADLSWTPGRDSPEQVVFFGTSSDAVANATDGSPEFKGRQAAATFDPGTLTPDTSYFWRVDQARPTGTTAGTVWQFTTRKAPTTISEPTPTDTATGVSVTVDLNWMAGLDVTRHEVYFGTSESAVTDADKDDTQFKGNQSGTSFDVGTLDPNKKYFWRIDEVGPGGTIKGDTLEFTTAAAPGMISNPDPSDGNLQVMVGASLSWTAGSNTETHNVYFGTTMSLVEQGSPTSSTFQGSQTETTFTPEDLEADTTYFWRVDEIGPGGTTTGDVLSFNTVSEFAAINPDPANDEDGVSLSKMLGWDAGEDADSHDVYFGTNESAVRDATKSSGEFEGNFPSTSFSPTLDPDTTYFWRVDEVDEDDNVVKGAVWKFTTAQTAPEKITLPMPADGATDVALSPMLTWTAGERANSHDVYFGTNMTNVMNATRSSSQFKGNRPNASYNTGMLARATDYFWRIDEVNSAGTTKGDVTMFTTVPEAPTKASNPTPANNATGQNGNDPVASQTVLMWTAGTGSGTITHDVYFGTDETTVALATTSSTTFKGNQTSTTYDPGALTPFTDYFWRIDERNAGGSTRGDVYRFKTAVAPDAATVPSPSNNSVSITLPVTLMWTAGANTTSHDVYFGISQSAVDTATRSSTQYRGNQAVGTTTFSSGFGVTIEGDTSYFWRIDEVGVGGVKKGTVWTFRTVPQAPDKATTPSPFNGNTNAMTSAVLSWATARGATKYHVYFGTDMTDVTNGAGGTDQGEQTSTSFNPGTLSGSTQYFWRIDTINDAGTTTGDVWTFTTQ